MATSQSSRRSCWGPQVHLNTLQPLPSNVGGMIRFEWRDLPWRVCSSGQRRPQHIDVEKRRCASGHWLYDWGTLPPEHCASQGSEASRTLSPHEDTRRQGFKSAVGLCQSGFDRRIRPPHPKAARKLLCRGGGMAWAPGEGGGGRFQKWASVPGPLFCVRTDVAAKGARTQILDRKIFFHETFFPHICVVKMISATWGSF